MVMAELYVKAAIHRMMGRGGSGSPIVRGKLEGGFCKSGMDGKRHFLRVAAAKGENGWAARLSGPQGSAQLTSMRSANALAMIPEDVAEVPDGGEVDLILFTLPA
jgi:molybdopterin molybdotransferase